MRTVKTRQILLTFLLVLVMALPAADAAQGATTKKTRRIHLVYDDSESMTWDEMGSDGGTSWSQAKYALEIFSAMAGETDTLAVYPMSAFYTDGSMDPSMPLILDGTSSGQTRVDKVASMANFAGTPIESVERAGSDLVADDSDEKHQEATDKKADRHAGCPTLYGVAKKQFADDDKGYGAEAAHRGY